MFQVLSKYMGQKVSPTALRLGLLYSWKSKWVANKKNYRKFLEEDFRLRSYIMEKLKEMGIARVEIERSANLINIVILTSRPGMIIGRGGTGVDNLKKELAKFTGHKPFKVTIEEVKNPEANAQLVARTIAEALEKRIPFRRVVKQSLERVKENRGVYGVKIMVAGRLNGATMKRREWVAWGKIPLHNLRADIDFVQDIARTTYGIIGIKVWIYKGEIFDQKEKDKVDSNQ